MLAIWRKDVAVVWTTPVPYIVGALFQGVLGLLFVDQLQGRRQALVQPLFPLAGFLLLVTVPILSMRVVAEERRRGTLDVLLAIPVGPVRLVIGKWLATVTTVLVVVAPTLAYAGLVALFGDPDPGPVIAGFVGLALLVVALSALGVVSSALTSSVPVAAMIAFVVAAVLWFAGAASGTVSTGGFLARLSLSERLRAFAGGAVDTADVGMLVALTVLFVGAAIGVIQRQRPQLFVFAVAAAVAISVGAATHQASAVFDLTAERSLSLTEETEAIVARVDARTTITAFLRVDDPERAPAAALLLRYRRLNDRIRYRLLDPEAASGEVRRLGVDPVLGGVAVARNDAVEIVPTVTEQDVTGALARLARGRSAEVCFTTGHGETSPSDEGASGLSRAGEVLVENGYRLRMVDLLVEATIPSACDAVVVASPTSPLGASAVAELRRWLDGSGRLLLLADPASPAPASAEVGPVVSGLGLGLRRGIVLEGDPELVLPDDPTAPIVRSYSSANPIVRRLAPTFFPGLQQVVVEASDPGAGLTVARLADTSPASYLETSPLTSSFDPADDVPGPITVAAAGDRVRLDGSSVRRSRAVVVGDVDFATNAVIGEAANSTFLVRSLDWLSLDEQLVVLSTNIASDRPLSLTSGRLAYARFVAVVLLPGLFLLAGAAVWVVRRGR